MSEKIILRGNSKLLKPVITELLAIHQLINERDIGEWCGYPMDEYVRATPQTFKLKIVFYSVPEPPWRKRNSTDRFVRATYNVPSSKRSAIDWHRVKQACGGSNGYMWGRWKATANTSDGRKMSVHGASESEAEQRLRELHQLSDSILLDLLITEEKKVGRRNSDKLLYKETTKVYPAYFTIVHQEKIITETNRALLDGNYIRTKFRIPLWTDTKPADCDEKILEALRVRGSLTPTG